jgi:hypothetical protein
MSDYMEKRSRRRTLSIQQDFSVADPDKIARAIVLRLPRPVVFPTTSPTEAITTTDGGAYHPVADVPKLPSWWDRLWQRLLGAMVIGSRDG